MRNLDNGIKRVKEHRGSLSKAIVVYTAKQCINQYLRGWLKPNDAVNQGTISEHGILELLEKPLIGRKLKRDLNKEGLTWMKKFFFTSKGKNRSTKDLQGFPERYFDIIRNFSHYTFDGFEYIDSGYYNEVCPKWRVHSRDGQSFAYTYSGGRFGGFGLSWFS